MTKFYQINNHVFLKILSYNIHKSITNNILINNVIINQHHHIKKLFHDHSNKNIRSQLPTIYLIHKQCHIKTQTFTPMFNNFTDYLYKIKILQSNNANLLLKPIKLLAQTFINQLFYYFKSNHLLLLNHKILPIININPLYYNKSIL